MKVLIFNENENPVSEWQNKTQKSAEQHLLQMGHEVVVMETSKAKIADCTGCWNCWLKTPGVCAINDDQTSFLKGILNVDLTIMISPVRKGFISAQLKRSIDRFIPISLPFFNMKEGELTHLHRYKKMSNMALLLDYETTLDEENKPIISDWLNRLCWNSNINCEFVYNVKDIDSVKNYFNKSN